jgi:hypothetical protein
MREESFWQRRLAEWTRILSQSPATFILVLIVAVTTSMLRSVDSQFADQLLRQQSTNLVQMSRDAPRVLLLSAFFLPDRTLSPLYLVFLVVLIAVERWFGSLRWLFLAAVSHCGASMFTTVMIWLQVRTGDSSPDAVYPVDVGVSYIVAGMMGAVLWQLRTDVRLVVALLMTVGIGIPALREPSFTNIGHLVAFTIGVVLGLFLRPINSIPIPPTPHDRSRGSSRLVVAWHWLLQPQADRLTNGRRFGWMSEPKNYLLAGGIAFALLTVGLGTILSDPPTATRRSSSALARATVIESRDQSVSVWFVVQGQRIQTSLEVPRDVHLRTGQRTTVSYEKSVPAIAKLGREEIPAVDGEAFFAFASGCTGVISIASLVASAVHRRRSSRFVRAQTK